MSFIESAGPAVTSAAFAVAAIFVWISGASLSRAADQIAERTGLGPAFVGVLLLGIATSLPELATTISAALREHPRLAGNNLMGGVAMQIAVLAVVGGFGLRGKALTHFGASPAFLMQGVFLILLLAVAAGGIVVGDRVVVAGIGAWPILLGVLYGIAIYVMFHYENHPRWQPLGDTPTIEPSGSDKLEKYATRSTPALFGFFGGAAAVVFVSGYFVAVSGERLAEQTGLGETFIGGTLVALATSLPEVSTTWSAVRRGAYAMAVGNIFGTNTLEVALFLPAEAFYRPGAIFNEMDDGAVFLGMLGIVMTCIYLWGVLERRDRTVWNFGIDSALVLIVYAAGLVTLYFIRG